MYNEEQAGSFVIGVTLLALICTYGVWCLLVLLLKGILTNSWYTIIGGGVLYLIFYIGILCVGVIVGLVDLLLEC